MIPNNIDRAVSNVLEIKVSCIIHSGAKVPDTKNTQWSTDVTERKNKKQTVMKTK